MTHDELCSGLNSVALSAALEDNALLRADIARLLARQQELLQTLVKLTQTTPFPDEFKDWESQRAKFVAEIGTLRAQVADLERRLEDWEGVA